jgi:ABC-2 type transport system ATP-binding protein
VVADGTPEQLRKIVPGCNSLDEVFRSITRSETAKKGE